MQKMKIIITFIYTQSQKKRTMERCVSFGEECRYMDFVVYSRDKT